MKIIDLLNKIANGEDVPEKIKLTCGYEYEYKTDELGFLDYIRVNTGNHLFGEDYVLDEANINKEIEILEDNKKIEKLEFAHTTYYCEEAKEFYEVFDANLRDVKDKINEIIDKLNEMSDK